MSVLMVAFMKVEDMAWMKSYMENVRPILAEYGGKTVARSVGNIVRIEGDRLEPNRVAILSFPSAEAAQGFLNDSRYQPFLEQRLSKATSEIVMFENGIDASTL